MYPNATMMRKFNPHFHEGRAKYPSHGLLDDFLTSSELLDSQGDVITLVHHEEYSAVNSLTLSSPEQTRANIKEPSSKMRQKVVTFDKGKPQTSQDPHMAPHRITHECHPTKHRASYGDCAARIARNVKGIDICRLRDEKPRRTGGPLR